LKNTPSIDSLALIDRLKKLSPDQRAQLLGKIGRPQSNLNASSTSSQLSKATPLRIESVDDVEMKIFPVSYAQYRMWFIDQLESNSSAYNMPSVLRLQGDLNHEAIRRSIETLVQRHEPYRTTFESKAGDPFQAIHPPRPFELPVVDLRELPDESREGELNKRILDERRMPRSGLSALYYATSYSFGWMVSWYFLERTVSALRGLCCWKGIYA
jgi:hypothetical protein